MKIRCRAGVVAGLLGLGLLAAGPAVAAGPANVNVRVEGESATLVPRAPVSTFAGTFGKDANPATCKGTSAAGALERATAGDWTARYFAQYQTYLIAAIKGETHEYPQEKSWAFWINYKLAETGACDFEVQEGDDVLFVPSCSSCASPEGPLELRVPAVVRPGVAAEVQVRESATVRDLDTYVTSVTERPAQGATVTAGGQTYTTDAAGVARIALPSGPVAIQATKPGFVRSATENRCATTGADGACGTQVPCATSGTDGRCGTADTESPVVKIAKIRDGWYFSRRHAPRTLQGTVSPDPSGLGSVQVRFKRQQGRACAAFDGKRERFRKRSCKRNASWFAITDRQDWSYLLPARLRPGRYTLEVMAIDKAGNRSALVRGASKVVFRVL
jgi:hypothetical protein